MNQLRRVFRYWSLRRGAIDAVTRADGMVFCAGHEGWVEYELKRVDHVEPVVPLTGFDGDWTALVDRMFYGRLQILCKKCHEAKTKEENRVRREHKAARNEPEGPAGS